MYIAVIAIVCLSLLVLLLVIAVGFAREEYYSLVKDICKTVMSDMPQTFRNISFDLDDTYGTKIPPETIGKVLSRYNEEFSVSLLNETAAKVVYKNF